MPLLTRSTEVDLLLMMRKLWMGLALFLLAACGGSGTVGDPADAVEKYLTAKIAADETALRGLLCSEKEADLQSEAMAFASVEGATLEDMDCQRAGDDKVTCTGKIVAIYGTENTEFPLVSYRVVQEDGEWKWCGESS